MNSRPNFVVIVPDQMRGDCYGAAGHPVVLTPNIDSIAHSGARFSQAYSTCPSCIAARRCLLTGRFPIHKGMVGYAEGVEWRPPTTLPGELRAVGYQTVHVGRTMHQHPPRNRFGYSAVLDGYQKFIEQELPGGWRQVDAHGISKNGWSARSWHVDERFHYTNWATDRALEFLETRDPACPLFLTLGFVGPHPPLVPPAFYFDRYLRQELPAPFIGDWAELPGPITTVESDQVNLTGETLRSCLAGYFGMINHIDDQLFRLLTALRDLPGDTYVILTSDHGEMLGDHYLFRKCVPYDGAARIPFVIRGPGIQPGTVCDRPVGLEDIMPTLLELADVPIPECVDGQSLVSLLRGGTQWRDYLHGEHAPCYGSHHAHHYLTDGQEKYCWFTQSGREQLFDLSKDPRELRDLVGDMKRVTRWRQRLIKELKGRPEGFTDGQRLIAGQTYRAVVPL